MLALFSRNRAGCEKLYQNGGEIAQNHKKQKRRKKKRELVLFKGQLVMAGIGPHSVHGLNAKQSGGKGLVSLKAQKVGIARQGEVQRCDL